MDRKTLILFGGAIALLIVAVIIAVFLRTGREGTGGQSGGGGVYDGSTTGKDTSQVIGSVTVYAPVAGWKDVKNTSDNVSVKIPEAWDVSGDTTNYSLKAATTTGSERVSFDVYVMGNPDNLSPANWAKAERNVTQTTPIKVDGFDGVRYTGKVVYGGGDFPYGSDEVPESYLASLVLQRDSEIIEVSCAVSGLNYESYKSTCEEILNTFKLH